MRLTDFGRLPPLGRRLARGGGSLRQGAAGAPGVLSPAHRSALAAALPRLLHPEACTRLGPPRLDGPPSSATPLEQNLRPCELCASIRPPLVLLPLRGTCSPAPWAPKGGTPPLGSRSGWDSKKMRLPRLNCKFLKQFSNMRLLFFIIILPLLFFALAGLDVRMRRWVTGMASLQLSASTAAGEARRATRVPFTIYCPMSFPRCQARSQAPPGPSMSRR